MRVHIFITGKERDTQEVIMQQERATVDTMQDLYEGCKEWQDSIDVKYEEGEIVIHLLDNNDAMTDQRCSVNDMGAYYTKFGKYPDNLSDALGESSIK